MSLKKLKDGRWRIRYFANGTKSGPRKQETLDARLTKDEAKRIYLDRLSCAAMRKGTAAQLVTFEQLAAEYLAVQGPRMAANSWARAAETIKHHLRPVFGHMLVHAIKAHHVDRWQRERLAKAKPATVNREWTVMKAILNFGESKELIERNPIRRGAVKLLRASNTRTDFFEPEEWRAFLAALDDPETFQRNLTKKRQRANARFSRSGRPQGVGARNPDSDASAAYFARLTACAVVLRALFYTGSRLGEILSLTWSAIDFKRGQITIQQHKTRTPKTLPICAPLRTLLEPFPRGIGDALVFRKRDGSPFYAMEIQRAFAVAKKLSGANAQLSVHSIRHTVGSWLTIAGHPERHIAEILGHSQRSITARYAHLGNGSLGPVLTDLVRIEADGFHEAEREAQNIDGEAVEARS